MDHLSIDYLARLIIPTVVWGILAYQTTRWVRVVAYNATTRAGVFVRGAIYIAMLITYSLPWFVMLWTAHEKHPSHALFDRAMFLFLITSILVSVVVFPTPRRKDPPPD